MKNAIRNGLVGVLFQILIAILGFINRKIFISTLSPTYLGLSGLFGNILGVMGIAELGIGNAIVFHLYNAIANKNKDQIAGLMQFYKNAYRIIAIITAFIGLTGLPFLKYIIKETPFSMIYLYKIYLLFLVQSVSTYFFSYKRSIFYANENDYICINVDIFFRILITVIGIVILLFTKNYVIYLISGIILNLINSIIISIMADRKYPFINKNVKMSKEKTMQIMSNVKDLFTSKILGIVLGGTDNILISAFVGLTPLGIYSNYNLIISTVQGLCDKLFSSAQPSFGNLVATSTRENILIVINRMTLLVFWVSSYASVCLLCLTQDFIGIWIGLEYTLPTFTLLICIINFYIYILRTPLWLAVNASGLFKEDRNIALTGSILNLVSSIILVHFVGMVGVFIGTTLSLAVMYIQKTKLYFTKYFKIVSNEYPVLIIKMFLITFLEMTICYFFCMLISFKYISINMLIKFVLITIVVNIANYKIYGKSSDFNYYLIILKNLGKNNVNN